MALTAAVRVARGSAGRRRPDHRAVGRVRPDLDSSPIGVIGRVSRLSRLVDRRLAENFARFGHRELDVRRAGDVAPRRRAHELTAGELVRQTMVTTGRSRTASTGSPSGGLVERTGADDRRKVVVRLTAPGLVVVRRRCRLALLTSRAEIW